MSTEQFITYWPSSRNLYEGKHTASDPGADSQHLLATMKKVDSSYKAELKSKELIKSARQIKSADAIANDANLEHLQVVRLHEEIMGAPDQPFYLHNAATVRNVDKLEARESWRSIGDSVRRKGRMEETKEKATKYTEIKYDVTKLAGKTWTPIEDKLRTVRDPEAIDLQNLDWEFAYARNAELKDVVTGITDRNASGAAGTDDLGDIRTTSSDMHSASNVANKISSAIKTFRVKNRVPIDVAVFDVTAWDQYVSNTWTGASGAAGPLKITIERYPNGGVTTMPGFPNITAVIEPEMPDDNKIRFFNRANGLRIAQGPKLYRRYYDEDKDAESVKILDFVQFLSVDKVIDHSAIGSRYFSFVASFDDS